MYSEAESQRGAVAQSHSLRRAAGMGWGPDCSYRPVPSQPAWATLLAVTSLKLDKVQQQVWRW